ncbi:MAG: hypothetical protein ABL993_02540 [Vicinamibacterales bacterium]
MLVKRFTGNTSGMGTRAAAKLIGVSHDRVAKLRLWAKAGADPEALPALEPRTVEGLAAHDAVAADVETRRAALRMAAERLELAAQEMRDEAEQPDAGAIPRIAAVGRGAAKRGRGK